MTKEMAAELLAWYDAGHRDLPWRNTKDPYRIWLSEIMLQQTRVEAVIPYYERFLQMCPDIEALAKAPEQVYLKLWEGLGYYSRVRNLHKAACLLCEEYGGQMPNDYKALLSLSGIGDYTASAIASIAFGLPEPAVDGNVLRVCARVQGDFRSVDDSKVKPETSIRRLWNWGRWFVFRMEYHAVRIVRFHTCVVHSMKKHGIRFRCAHQRKREQLWSAR